MRTAQIEQERSRNPGVGQGAVGGGAVPTVVQNLAMARFIDLQKENMVRKKRYPPSTEKNNWRLENVFTFYFCGKWLRRSSELSAGLGPVVLDSTKTKNGFASMADSGSPRGLTPSPPLFLGDASAPGSASPAGLGAASQKPEWQVRFSLQTSDPGSRCCVTHGKKPCVCCRV